MAKKIELSTNLIQAIHATWQEIGSDAISASQETGQRLTNAGAIETCIDADRLDTLGGKEGKAADEEVSNLIKVHGYPAVARALCKEVRLV